MKKHVITYSLLCLILTPALSAQVGGAGGYRRVEKTGAEAVVTTRAESLAKLALLPVERSRAARRQVQVAPGR